MKYRKVMLQSLEFFYVMMMLALFCPSLLGEKTAFYEEAYSDAQMEPGESEQETVREKPQIALTFDDGPNAQFTPELLDGLKERGVKVTFFLIGKNIEKDNNREIVKRMYEEGHVLGNHTYNHVDITKLSDEEAYQELKQTNDLVREILGVDLEYMRPPFGVWQKELEKKLHVLPVLWTVDPLDWTSENTDEIVHNVVTDVEENDIILMHDCYDSSVKAALRIIDLLQAEGYEFVTVEELMMP